MFKIFITLFVLLFLKEILPQMESEKVNIQDNSFETFLAEVQTTDKEKESIVDDFISKVKQKGYPFFETDSNVVLLYRGDADSVYLIGDMTNWDYFQPLEKIKGTDLFYYKGKFETTARLEYWFIFKKDGIPFTDPLNKYKSLNGLGELSVLSMPGYIKNPIFKDFEEGKKGNFDGLIEYQIPSKYLGYDHTIHIYLPPGYKEDQKYPSLYFQDGRDYIEFAVVPHILNELINSKKIKPVIAVFVTPPNLHQPKVPNRMTEYGMNDNYAKFFAEELINFVDEKYSLIQRPGSRLLIGDSFGGLISTYIAFKYPDVFGMSYSQSGYHSFNKDKLIKLIDSSGKKQIKLYIDSGTYERKVGASFLPADETDFLEGNRRLKEVLEEKKYDFIYKEYFEGHTWGNWRRHLIDALIYFYGAG